MIRFFINYVFHSIHIWCHESLILYIILICFDSQRELEWLKIRVKGVYNITQNVRFSLPWEPTQSENGDLVGSMEYHIQSKKGRKERTTEGSMEYPKMGSRSKLKERDLLVQRHVHTRLEIQIPAKRMNEQRVDGYYVNFYIERSTWNNGSH